ncbi:hypothetical protein [Bacillus cereus]|uniref:hypothetical protein n=1 Tax=Bacillus cereus TaxID=1396 RepID=UPI000B23B016|nr:hypothetical protein [Bacillus cereus]
MNNNPNKDIGDKRPIETFIDVVLSKIVSKIIKIQSYEEARLNFLHRPREYEFKEIKVLTKDWKKTVVNKIVER